MRVLIVEDDDRIAEALCSPLSKAGFAVEQGFETAGVVAGVDGFGPVRSRYRFEAACGCVGLNVIIPTNAVNYYSG